METELSASRLYSKVLGCLVGGLIGDAVGAPTEGLDYRQIESRYGWLTDFSGDGTDDTVMKNLLAEALIRTDGYATLDDWAQVWLDRWDSIFGVKLPKFFYSVIHTAQKLRLHAVPRMAALGNMPSSSSAMCISPVGLVNAGNPAQAALQAYNLAGLIHVHDVGFCQDGAAAMAAGVAEALKPTATVTSILGAAQAYLLKLSGYEMHERITALLALARAVGDYREFRAAVYAREAEFFCRIMCDSRETVPLSLAFFLLGEGDLERSVVSAANFGRDADTTASMVGALASAWKGADGIRSDWVETALRVASTDPRELAQRLAATALRKAHRETSAWKIVQDLAA